MKSSQEKSTTPCRSCNTQKPTSELEKCTECSSQFCINCLNECDYCKQKVCKPCASETSNVCKTHPSRTFCHECMEGCGDCSHQRCKRCIRECPNCAEKLCVSCLAKRNKTCFNCQSKVQDKDIPEIDPDVKVEEYGRNDSPSEDDDDEDKDEKHHKKREEDKVEDLHKPQNAGTFATRMNPDTISVSPEKRKFQPSEWPTNNDMSQDPKRRKEVISQYGTNEGRIPTQPHQQNRVFQSQQHFKHQPQYNQQAPFAPQNSGQVQGHREDWTVKRNNSFTDARHNNPNMPNVSHQPFNAAQNTVPNPNPHPNNYYPPHQAPQTNYNAPSRTFSSGPPQPNAPPFNPNYQNQQRTYNNNQGNFNPKGFRHSPPRDFREPRYDAAPRVDRDEKDREREREQREREKMEKQLQDFCTTLLTTQMNEMNAAIREIMREQAELRKDISDLVAKISEGKTTTTALNKDIQILFQDQTEIKKQIGKFQDHIENVSIHSVYKRNTSTYYNNRNSDYRYNDDNMSMNHQNNDYQNGNNDPNSGWTFARQHSQQYFNAPPPQQPVVVTQPVPQVKAPAPQPVVVTTQVPQPQQQAVQIQSAPVLKKTISDPPANPAPPASTDNSSQAPRFIRLNTNPITPTTTTTSISTSASINQPLKNTAPPTFTRNLNDEFDDDPYQEEYYGSNNNNNNFRTNNTNNYYRGNFRGRRGRGRGWRG